MDYEEFEKNCRLWGTELALEEETSTRNIVFPIYRKIALVLASGISIASILNEMGISKVEVYGYGELGQLLIENIQGKIEITRVYDKGAGQPNKLSEITLDKPDNIKDNEIPLIVTPCKYFRQIFMQLVQKGINRKKIISLNAILSYGMEKKMRGETYNIPQYAEKKFLVTGAGFHNDGAQAMLFVATSEIRERFPNAEIWFQPIDQLTTYTEKIQRKYKMHFLTDGIDLRSELYDILPNFEAIVDVSGYSLSSNFPHRINARYMNILRMAYNYKIPLYLMPQSFGPLEFEEETNREIGKLLTYAKVIFARETYAYDLLKDTYKLTNVRKSIDLVLQNKGLEFKHIYTAGKPEKCIPTINTDNNIAIVPNIRNYEFGNKDEILAVYREIIKALLEENKEIYIFSHSNDTEICEDIYRLFQNHDRVHLELQKLDCVEFCEYVCNFQYLVASRFHAIVHAYKNDIPCFVLGWAEKYRELAKMFHQESYAFDVRKRIESEEVVKQLMELNRKYKDEKLVISEQLQKIQEDNCFDCLSKGVE